jgi:hypothetical protein
MLELGPNCVLHLLLTGLNLSAPSELFPPANLATSNL